MTSEDKTKMVIDAINSELMFTEPQKMESELQSRFPYWNVTLKRLGELRHELSVDGLVTTIIVEASITKD